MKRSKPTATARRGSAVLPVILAMTLVVIIVGLTLDVSTVLDASSDLQRAADACAVVAVRQLDEDPSRVRAAVAHVASTHLAAGARILVEANPDNDPDGDVVIGNWDPVIRAFTPGCWR